ncbi:MAG: outer membrane protein assembly factor BamC [Nitrosomonas sp.]|uniref:outer membrane protein assembly factor BamC n=1 Tax=Nitrosomonas sp. TaxID=42353 RepID=UPI001DF791AE|nr:outer membrane protein assembly factor BamC [Nitrosomonas sp.]MBX9894027.1 outer membrane protein assembly factor BamC [Nitrosomonas sp.]
MNWRKVIVTASVLPLSLVQTGCKTIDLFPDTKTIDYKSAGRLPALDIPPDLVQPAIDERYSIPELSSSGSATFSSYNNERGGQQTTGMSTLLPSSIQNVHIERSGTQRWLVIPQSPDLVWPVVKEFWQELGFLIKIEIPEAGIMETDWAENRAKIPQDFIRTFISTFLDSIYSTAERDKFRTRLERNETGNTEIYISHRGMTEVLEGNLNRSVWQPRPADPDLEAEMLSRLMMRFGVEEQKAKMELLTGRSSTYERAFIDKEETSLLVYEAFDRSWRRVGLALDRIGFTVEDRNREEGIYYVRFVDLNKDSKKKGDDEGILSNIMFWRSGDKDDSKAAKYRIHVHNAGTNSSNITLSNDDGSAVNSVMASRILKLLHEQLK